VFDSIRHSANYGRSPTPSSPSTRKPVTMPLANLPTELRNAIYTESILDTTSNPDSPCISGSGLAKLLSNKTIWPEIVDLSLATYPTVTFDSEKDVGKVLKLGSKRLLSSIKGITLDFSKYRIDRWTAIRGFLRPQLLKRLSNLMEVKVILYHGESGSECKAKKQRILDNLLDIFVAQRKSTSHSSKEPAAVKTGLLLLPKLENIHLESPVEQHTTDTSAAADLPSWRDVTLDDALDALQRFRGVSDPVRSGPRHIVD
jgi:hypothetical protein